jgi:hypothetical protein
MLEDIRGSFLLKVQLLDEDTARHFRWLGHSSICKFGRSRSRNSSRPRANGAGRTSRLTSDDRPAESRQRHDKRPSRQMPR